MSRYDYASYKSYEQAATALEQMFAQGDVSTGERPHIEKRSGRTRTDAPLKTRYVITLEG